MNIVLGVIQTVVLLGATGGGGYAGAKMTTADTKPVGAAVGAVAGLLVGGIIATLLGALAGPTTVVVEKKAPEIAPSAGPEQQAPKVESPPAQTMPSAIPHRNGISIAG